MELWIKIISSISRSSFRGKKNKNKKLQRPQNYCFFFFLKSSISVVRDKEDAAGGKYEWIDKTILQRIDKIKSRDNRINFVKKRL